MAQRQQLLRAVTSRKKDIAFWLQCDIWELVGRWRCFLNSGDRKPLSGSVKTEESITRHHVNVFEPMPGLGSAGGIG